MNKKGLYFLIMASIFTSLISCASTSTENVKDKILVSIDFDAPKKTISPYIYGINDGANLNFVHPKSIRLGGNRMTAYNWENNLSNAGSDWYHSSDDYMVQRVRPEYKRVPGGAALNVSRDAFLRSIPYTLLTLQMAGYVANSNGRMTKDNALDGKDWCKVENRKNAEFTLEPDKKDNVIYTDEYLNYLGQKIGKSDSVTGFKAYALDNEPALWNHTHPLIQREPLYAKDLIEKSVSLASTVKDFDPNAAVFGPSLFGYSAFVSLGADWTLIQSKSFYKYNWFIDFYLDQMQEAEKEYGKRLLDVLDIHYYTEAKGGCGKRKCNHYDNDECIRARINSVRSLYDPNYKERSWIQDGGAKFFPLLQNLESSIDKFYPGTKLAFTEYDFGGGTDISGAIAQADFLGLLAEHEVFFASIWAFDKADYQFAAINMFTNYDDYDGYFGDRLISSTSSDDYVVSSFVAENDTDGKLHIILTNKEIHECTEVTIDVSKYGCSEIEHYILDKGGPDIYKSQETIKSKNGKIKIVLNPLTVNHLVISK